jgi:NCAIR mutase (PurE)-related protein
MTAAEMRQLLADVQGGKLGLGEAAARLSEPAVGDLGFATLDLHRKERCGFPEVVFAEGKTAAWVEQVVRRLAEAGQDCFATRVSAEQAEHLAKHFPQAEQDRLARTLWLPATCPPPAPAGRVLVLTAGTGDLPVAQEAVNTARVMGAGAELIADVGVAGIHRVLRHRDTLAAADVIVVVAGMDGALPSVVGGLVDSPVIAVPTSIGYGAAFGGVAALLTMLNSCSAGVTVVNIDAGFKAGYVAALLVRRLEKARHHAEKQNARG